MKNLYSLIVGIVLGALICFLYIKSKEVKYVFDEDKINQKIDSLNRENDTLNQKINQYDKKIKDYQNNIDSLQLIKQQIKTIYVTKNKQIDTASVPYIIDKFKGIFAKGDN